MKKITHIIIWALAFISSAALAQTKEVRNVDKFTKITSTVSGNIYLKQGSPQKVELEGKADILADIETEVSRGKLTIRKKGSGYSWGWHKENPLNVYITVENIEALNMSGSGNLVGQTKFTGNNVDLTVSGSGALQAEMELTGAVDVDLSGSGDINLKGKFQNLKNEVSGSGDVVLSVIVANQVDFDISGSGKIKASGTAQNVKASISGSGNLYATNLVTDKYRVHISGSGDAAIDVNGDLDAGTSGSGDVTYRGNPSHVITHNSGSGSVRKIE
ncbi:head GIN domain-containing protein [Solimicrobium silvestre]|uniref:Putative auto-transporter adhesin head GIN domain-containing protein n=1 Tax=Solimicrobium silvestre TaxID=2099400 RepID=A0A2S9H3X8_9BURK|nr:head GIN domain-containing protein [Solimicrobium silvestre]PRC94678.1 hypothetical protein S2091_0681 [Solimicrobium silvestre]